MARLAQQKRNRPPYMSGRKRDKGKKTSEIHGRKVGIQLRFGAESVRLKTDLKEWPTRK
jgi:hypothetical protein